MGEAVALIIFALILICIVISFARLIRRKTKKH